MKLSHAFIMVLALPVGLAAQQPAPPGPPKDPMATVFRNRTTQLRRNLAQAFDSIPAAKFSYKPTPAQMTIGAVANHLAGDNYFFCSNFSEKKPTRADEDTSTPDSVKAGWPKEKLVAKLKESIAFCDDVMTGLDDTKVNEIITVPGPNNTTRQVSRINSLLGHAIDLADHYSQIANYMRLNGLLPPTALPRPSRGGTE